MRLENKVAVVTGASSGMGKAITTRFVQEGAKVVAVARRIVRLEELAESLKGEPGEIEIFSADITSVDKNNEMIDFAVEKFGHLDILVNNAGITRDGLLMGMKEEDFDSVINVNLKGTFNTIRFASRTMVKQRKGKIINISSVSGVTGNAGQANYSASKAGIIGLTKSAARELASRNINVNAIAPGFVDTDMTITLSDKVKEGAKGQIPLGRFGKPEEVAELALFLSSEKSDYITGQVINIDGGMVM